MIDNTYLSVFFIESGNVIITNRSSTIVCIGCRWNLLGQVGGTPGVGVLDCVYASDFCISFSILNASGWVCCAASLNHFIALS